MDSIFGGLLFCNVIVVTKKTSSINQVLISQLISVLDACSCWLFHDVFLRLCCLSKCSNRSSFWAMHRSSLLKKWACVFAGSSLMMMICGVAGLKGHFQKVIKLCSRRNMLLSFQMEVFLVWPRPQVKVTQKLCFVLLFLPKWSLRGKSFPFS